MVLDKTKEWYLNRSNVALIKQGVVTMKVGLTAGEGFLVGMFAKTIAATMFYPITRVKVMSMGQKKKKNESRSKKHISGGEEGAVEGRILSPIEVAKKLWKEDGLAGFFNGIEGQVANASLKQALMLMVKEEIEMMVFRLFMPAHFESLKAAAAAKIASANGQHN
jgi:hypothetical protein